MADTRTQLEVEEWIRKNWMPAKYGQTFHPKRIRLSSGGFFEFDAVSGDGKIAATISTSGARTASGRNAVGKILKVRSDIFFLIHADTERRICLLTELDMYEFWLRERENGRVPRTIEFACVNIPGQLRKKLSASRRIASKEVSPIGIHEKQTKSHASSSLSRARQRAAPPESGSSSLRTALDDISMAAPTSSDFQSELNNIYEAARQKRVSHVDVISGDLHRRVGGYPGPKHRMPTCCSVMRKNMKKGDRILEQPRKGKRATLKIRYRIH